MKITMANKMLGKIRVILEIIEKRLKLEPKKETFVFSYEEFSKPSILKDSIGRNLAFKEIEKETKGNILISEFEVEKDPHSKIWTPSTWEIGVHIEDVNEFKKYKKQIEQQLKTVADTFSLVLNNNGELHVEGEKESKNYPMEINALRYKIVHFLASRKEYVETKDLADEFEISPDKIRKVIESTKRMIEKFLKINDGNKIIENKKGLGYRITKIKIREK